MWKRPDPVVIPLPRSPAFVPGCFWRPTPAFIEDLAKALRGKRVLEVFAGNGYLAALLKARGITVTATSVPSSMDAHDRGVYTPILELDAVDAVQSLGREHDVLLMCWPTVTSKAVQAAALWSRQAERDICFIGEFPDYARGHLGGCATDEFFAGFTPTLELPSYAGNVLERACLGRLTGEELFDQVLANA